ncbi:TetR family transcriptional regulator, partial [Pseudomonas aeruginosa]|uniref:TetR family transcriptional regulator n=1 Tax=Pseudomonas aeruginosa TaxID=287 RepID=UPI0039836707
MARKTKEESQRTRDRILDAAEHVFLSKGVAGTTMSDIADHAGVSRGAVYGHYKNKIDVCIAMCDRALGEAATLTQVSTDGEVLESLYASMRQYSSEVEAFLSWLANERKVSVSTHRQALAALLFFYGKVL